MKKVCITLFFLLILNSLFAQTINLRDITDGKYRAKGVASVASSADGEFYFQANQQKTQITKYAYKTGTAVATVFDVKTARDCSIDSFEGFIMSPDENRIIVYTNSEPIYRRSFKADYYYFDIRRNMIRKLTDNKSKQMAPLFSKDGRMLAYVCDNNIWLSKFDYGTESQVTTDGVIGKIIEGATDWVYEEEFGVTALMDFSPDNKLLSFIRFDETAVPLFAFQNFSGRLYPNLVPFKYPKAGEPNSKVTCLVFDIDSKTTREITFPANTEFEYIAKIRFTPTSQLAIITSNRNQNDFNIYFADPRTTLAKLILREQNDKYIDYNFFNSIYFAGDQFYPPKRERRI